MMGVLEPPSGRVAWVAPVHCGACDAPNVSGDCSGNDSAGCKCVADDTIRAIVDW